ncbi:hypothetical protein Mgra_00001140 [Meloidogyne graminicola]|uniref:Uncharacterized protein n=1 Tax=Meloidogyne graminicola TaxID=189291 RepID=A0A8T0A3C0_9BILA|nr:hypothetical protein Mgra_00001140 [Meloidogyne graminicola]
MFSLYSQSLHLFVHFALMLLISIRIKLT